MSTSERRGKLRGNASALALLLALALLPAAGAAQAQRYGLGQAATAGEIAGWDTDVKADGTGLPAGGGTAARGAILYGQQCVACHGVKGAGGPANKLAGGFGTLNTPGAQKTIGSFWPYATTVFDYVRRAMPHNAPQSLSNDEVYALTAYLLNLNGIVGENDEINAGTLPKVRMPNRAGFKPVAD